LRPTFAVADVDEDHAAEVASGMDPAAESGRVFHVFWPQFVAVMCALHGL
jgi:hypothetical protein